MIPRIPLLWLFDLFPKKFLFVTFFIALVSPILGNGKIYDCQTNPLECTYGQGKYAASSGDCADRHPNCREYALRGNCIRNFQWMEAQCPLSCGICRIANNEHQDCIDHHPNCPKWASEQECFINPPFINGACPKSCMRCVNTADVSSEHDDKAKVQARIQYSQTDFGVWQSLPLDDLNLVPATTQVLVQMGEYAQELLEEETERIRGMEEEEEAGGDRQLSPKQPLLGPKAVCNNMRYDCAVLVARNGCSSGPHLEMMLQECSFACKFCHETYTYQKCRFSNNHGDRVSLESATSMPSSKSIRNINHHIWSNLSTKHGAVNLAQTSATTKIQDEWVASLKYMALWKDNEQVQRNQLLQVAISVFQDETTTCNSDDGAFQQGGRSVGADGGRIATCNGPRRTDNRDASTTTTVSPLSLSCQELEQEMAKLLGIISPEYLEPLELLHFGHTNTSSSSSTTNNTSYPRQVPMPEFDIHDQWKPSGHVLFTMLIILQPAKKGGAIGFPDLDWLIVEDAEILVWPTTSKATTSAQYHHQELTNMKSEILPVIQGDLYAIKIRVREYSYTFDPDCVS